MRQFFRPVTAPTWLSDVLTSIRGALSDEWPTPIKLSGYATLPPVADWPQGLAYDTANSVVKYSTGANWLQLAAYDSAGAFVAPSTIKTATYTVAGLPAAGTAGRRAFVTDANATTFASIVAAGGANGVPVYDDGTNWRIG
jgi:hypothetical protein